MKRLIMGVLLGVTILSHPVQSEAHERQCPKTIEVTYEEAQELMQIASAEALNQGEDGMLMVMSVVLNRVNSPDFPNSIHAVIHQSHQFYVKGMQSAEITPEVHTALAKLEMGNIYPELIAFERSNNTALDMYFSKAYEYKEHTFYTVKH
jgi:N-acetylmuramoyl-L-alanine amidase